MNRFGHVVTLLQWDMRTGMPKGGLEKHVDAVAHFSTEQFQMSVAEELGNLLEALMMQSEYDALDDTWKFIVKKMKRVVFLFQIKQCLFESGKGFRSEKRIHFLLMSDGIRRCMTVMVSGINDHIIG